MHEREAVEADGIARDDVRYLTIRHSIIGVKRGKQHRALGPGSLSAVQVAIKGRGCVPRASQPIAFPGVAVAIDDYV
jgi:hypothetical protein